MLCVRGFKNVINLSILGTSCGVGLTTIGIAGAGIGVYMFKRSMHKMNYNSFLRASRSFSNYCLAQSKSRSMTSQVLLRDNYSDETLTQNQSNNPWAFLDDQKKFRDHWYIAEVPTCFKGCEKDGLVSFSGYDKLKCALNTTNCPLLIDHVKITIVGLNTHDGEERMDLNATTPIYQRHLNSANMYDRVIFKRLAKFIASNVYTNTGFDHEGIPRPQYIQPLREHNKLIISLEQAACMKIFDSELLKAGPQNDRINTLINYFRDLDILPPGLF